MAQPCSLPLKRPRFGEPLKFVPVGLVVFVIFTEWVIYMWCHILPQLQFDRNAAHVHKGMLRRGTAQLVVFNLLTVMLVVCYLRSVLTHPGEVPDTEEWEYVPPEARLAEAAPVNLQESKKSGDRRYCKWCGKFKPDRCHHCRICRTCVLKMDHHCPWIYNCVGYFNYKYFFLLLFYTGLTLHFMVWTMMPTVIRASLSEERFIVLFLVFFGEVLGLFFAFLVTVFWCFHIWLICKAMTTIEFCEKTLPNNQKDPDKAKGGYDSSVYTLGIYANFKAILGTNPLTVLLPVPANTGDGLSYVSEETRLVKDMESTKGMRIKGHRITQRSLGRPYGYGATSGDSTPLESPLPGPGLTPRTLEAHQP